jgi:hypothetical protein
MSFWEVEDNVNEARELSIYFLSGTFASRKNDNGI